MTRIPTRVRRGCSAVALVCVAWSVGIHASAQPAAATQQLARQVDPALVVYFDTLVLADQTLQYAAAMRRITPAQAAGTLRARATQLAKVDMRGLDPTVVGEHRAAMAELMQQLETAIATSNRWPQDRAPNDYRALARATLQRLRAKYDQQLARGVAPTATAPALVTVFAWTGGDAKIPAAFDWIAGDFERIDVATQDVLAAAASQAAAQTIPPLAQGPAGAPPPAAPSKPAAPPAATAAPSPPPSSPGAIRIPSHPAFGPAQLGMDIFDGADYRSFHFASGDPAVCLAECARDSRCRSVTYTMPGTYGAAEAACWLKERTGRFGPHPSAISAVKLAAANPATPTTPATATPATPPVVRPPPAQCDIGGQWRMNTQNVGQSTWTFSPLGGNRYSGQETGLGNASGTASVNGNSLRLEWRTGSYSGVVELTLDASCRSAQGRQVFHTPQPGVQPSAWTRIGPAPPLPGVTSPPPVGGGGTIVSWDTRPQFDAINAGQMKIGDHIRYTCTAMPANRPAGARVWGTGPYDISSFTCDAAVHAGVIGPQGGSFTVTVTGPLGAAPGEVRNGVQSFPIVFPTQSTISFSR